MKGLFTPPNGGLFGQPAGGAGAGSVTSVSVVTAHGFGGSVADPTGAPAITISTSVVGLLKGDGTAVSAAIAGTDFAGLGSVNVYTAAQRSTFVPLTDGSTITPDFSQGNNFKVALAGSRTLAMPTNIAAGQSGEIDFWQDGTGSRTITFGGNQNFPYEFVGNVAPVLSTGAFMHDVLPYSVSYYATSAVTMTIAAPGVVTWTGHGLISGQSLELTTTGALPTGLSASTRYWVTVIDANTFKLSSSFANCQAGTFITTSGSQSGVHTATACGITLLINSNVR